MNVHDHKPSSSEFSPPRSRAQLFTRPPLPIYLFVMNMVILAILFPALTLIFQHGYKNFMERDMESRVSQMRQDLENNIASLMQSMLATSALAIGSYEFFLLQQQVAEVAGNDQRIHYLILMDNQGNAVVHSDATLVLSQLAGPMDMQALALLQSEFPQRQPQEWSSKVRFFSNEAEASGAESLIIEGLIPIYSAGKLWGVLRCGQSLEELRMDITASKQKWKLQISGFNSFLYRVMAATSIFAAIAALLFSRGLTRSTARLAHGVEMIAKGDLDLQIFLPTVSCQEFCSLSDGFNRMTSNLRLARQQLDDYSHSLEEKVKERTRELKEAQAELLSQAREAGMAEMAIGVLHNIGNAITPAKVDVTILLNELQSSSFVKNLPAALAPFQRLVLATQDLEEAEKARLSRILEILPKGIEEERRKLYDCLDRIRGKHEHIEEIVRLQMRYAHFEEQQEKVDLNLVIEDALKMLAETIQKRGVRIETSLGDIAPVRLEHTRLMQVIVNIIKNSYEAIAAGPGSIGQGVIQVFTLQHGQQVVLSIKDNGVGFSGAEAEKMFRFGYSTKERGTGFGLHASANYLIAKDGTIKAHSPGLGKGAEITISLPVAEDPALITDTNDKDT